MGTIDTESFGSIVSPPGRSGSAWSAGFQQLTAQQVAQLAVRGWSGLVAGNANYGYQGGFFGSPSVALALGADSVVVGKDITAGRDSGGYTGSTDWLSVGTRVQMATDNDRGPFLLIWNHANFALTLAYVATDAAGHATLGTNITGGSSLDTSLVVADNNPHYVEVVFSVVAASIDILVDGVSGGSITFTNTGVPNADSVGISYRGSPTSKTLFSDMYFLDNHTQGNTGALGPIRVECLFPTSDVSNQFISSGGANHAMVSEAPEDALATYVASDVVGDTDWYDHSALASSSGVPLCYNICAIADRSDNPPRQLEVGYQRNGGGDSFPAWSGTALNNGAAGWNPTYVRQPNDSDYLGPGFSIAEINASQIGMKVYS